MVKTIKCSFCGNSNLASATICTACGARLEPISSPIQHLAVGTKLLSGNYAVGKVLGQGGFGSNSHFRKVTRDTDKK